MSEIAKSEITFGIKLIAIVNGIAAIFHLAFWTAPLTKLTLLIPSIQAPANGDMATIYGLGLSDLI